MNTSTLKNAVVFFMLIFGICIEVIAEIPETTQPGDAMKSEMIFSVFAETPEQLNHALVLVESVRTFCGEFADSPVWIYMPESLKTGQTESIKRLTELKAECRLSPEPIPETARMYYAQKVYAASAAEQAAEKESSLLIWMDEDTVFLRQPDCLKLEKGIVFGYRPVMHNRSGVAWESEPNPFWQRIYELLNVNESMMFPMVTPADQIKIQPYFNAGLLAVRPGRKIMRRWVDCFEKLCRDEAIVEMCMEKVDNRIFVHQTALVGAVLPHLKRDQMTELPDTVNYPLFFDQMFGAKGKFEDLSKKTSIRYDMYFRNPAPDWADRLKGDPKLIRWLKAHLK